MLGYSMCYVVIPALMFERTRSAAVAGAALIMEGIVRAALALLAGPVHARAGSGRAVVAAEAFRLLAIALLACCLVKFSVVLVVAASLLYQFGFSLLVLEQELRCAQLGDEVGRGQIQFRGAELGVVPAVLLAALGGQWLGAPYATMLAIAAAASVAQLASARRWLPRASVHPATGVALSTRIGHALRYLKASPHVIGSMATTLISFAFYSWAVFAAPFLVQGRQLFGIALDSPSGTALFKSLLALSGAASLLFWGRVLRTNSSALVVAIAGMGLPMLFWFGLRVPPTAWAVVFFALGCIAHFGVISWQRAWRQHAIPEEHRQGLTALYLSVETLGVSLTGAILISGQPAIACAAAALALAALQVFAMRSKR
jgi:hypothetical protein